MNVLHVAPAFFPATYWGGPTQSVHDLCNALARFEGVRVTVLATDTAGPGPDERVQFRSYPEAYPGGYDVYFCRKRIGVDVAPRLIPEVFRLVSQADVVHLTGVYSFPTIPTLIACRILRKPLVWSPRGALQQWKGARRRGIKSIWTWLCNLLLKKERTVLHVTSVKEMEASLGRLPGVAARCIPNGVTVTPRGDPRRESEHGALRLLFLGRLHPIKGLENLIEAVRILPDPDVTLAVHGAGDEYYLRSLRQHVERAGLQGRVEFLGFVQGDAKTAAFDAADICVIPSHSENFGMVIAEALAHGVPVVASDGTPWQELPRRRCGEWVPNDPMSLAEAIQRLRQTDLVAAGIRGREWMIAEFSWAAAARHLKEVYEALASKAPSPR